MILPGLDWVTLLFVGAISLVSALAWRNPWWFERLAFDVGAIRAGRQWDRFLTSGLVHTGIFHLLFNMLTLWSFGPILYAGLGALRYGLLFFGSLLCGSALSWFLHRRSPAYRAVGASGAISGVILGVTVLHPHIGLSILLIPLFIPAWIFSVLFTVLSLFGLKLGLGAIGHDAHLGGAFFGTLITLAMRPDLFHAHFLYLSPVVLLCIGFLVILMRNPEAFS